MRQIIGEIFNEYMLLSLNLESRSGGQVFDLLLRGERRTGGQVFDLFLREEKAGAKAASIQPFQAEACPTDIVFQTLSAPEVQCRYKNTIFAFKEG